MPTESSSASLTTVSMAMPAGPGPLTSSFDERWAAWQTRGAAHDRKVRRRFAILAPIVVLLAVAILYALAVR
jgi:hypothetical protein